MLRSLASTMLKTHTYKSAVNLYCFHTSKSIYVFMVGLSALKISHYL